MTFDEIMGIYYRVYRGDDEVPSTSDAEYITAVSLANDAVQRWANVDGVLWRELWVTLTDAVNGEKTILEAQSTYSTPTDFKHPGGFIRLTDGEQATQMPLIQPEEAQKSGGAYAYLIGNANSGIKVQFSEQALVGREGWTIEYDYYKHPIFLATSDTNNTLSVGSVKFEMYDPMFVVHHMLANRFRASRNNTGYSTAKRDAEIALQAMQHRNMMGTHDNLWRLDSFSGGAFGV